MKRLHRPDLFGWSTFNERLDIDFNSVLWVRAGGNVAVDPLPMSEHDREHLRSLGGVGWIVVTNSAHARGAEELAKAFGARIAGPRAEQATLGVPCERWLGDDEELVSGLRAFELQGSKTPGELALVLERDTLITGDLVRAHRADGLMLLKKEQGLADLSAAARSVGRLLGMGPFRAVLVGDGFNAYRDGHQLLRELWQTLVPPS